MPTPSSPRWEEHQQRLRLEWERQYPNTPWNDIQLGYRYGWEEARRPYYANRSWEAAESELCAGWDSWQARERDQISQQFQQTWDDLKHSIRAGWEQARRESDLQ